MDSKKFTIYPQKGHKKRQQPIQQNASKLLTQYASDNNSLGNQNENNT